MTFTRYRVIIIVRGSDTMVEYISVSQYAKKHNKDVGNVRRLLIQKRLNGMKIGNQWIINSDEKYPDDK